MTDEQIIAELGFTNGSSDMKARVIENVRTLVELRVIGVITESLSDEQKATFDHLQQGSDNQAVWNWLRDEVVGTDVSQLYEATLADYIEQRKNDTLQF